MICLTVGGVTLIISIVGIFTGRSVNIKYLLMAIVLLWVGNWCTGVVIELFGFDIGDSSTSGQTGYH